MMGKSRYSAYCFFVLTMFCGLLSATADQDSMKAGLVLCDQLIKPAVFERVEYSYYAAKFFFRLPRPDPAGYTLSVMTVGAVPPLIKVSYYYDGRSPTHNWGYTEWDKDMLAAELKKHAIAYRSADGCHYTSSLFAQTMWGQPSYRGYIEGADKRVEIKAPEMLDFSILDDTENSRFSPAKNAKSPADEL